MTKKIENNHLKAFHVLYATDKKYLEITLASILSLIENSKLENLVLHIVTEKLEEPAYQKIEKVMRIYPQIKYYIYPLEDYHIEKYHLPEWKGSQSANARLFFQEILAKQLDEIDNLLYLDSDTIIVDQLTDFYRFPEHLIYASHDELEKKYYKYLNIDTYYNSGVLYINKEAWIKEDCQQKIIEFVGNHSDLNFQYPDQDTFNCVLHGKIEPLSLSYNLPPYILGFTDTQRKLYCLKKGISYPETCTAKSTPKILHSYGLFGIKPWMKNTVNPYNQIFRDYLSRVDPNFELCEAPSHIPLVNSKARFYPMLLTRTYMPDALHQPLKKMISKVLIKK